MKRITLLSLVFVCLYGWSATTWTVNKLTAVGATGTGIGDVPSKSGDLLFCVENAASGDIVQFATQTVDIIPLSMNGATITFSTTLAPAKVLVFDASSLTNGIIFDGGNAKPIINYTVTAGSPAGTGLCSKFFNITFQNGLTAVTNDAGGIKVVTDSIRFENCKFIGNSNTLASGNTAGAIFHNRSVSTMQIVNCVFRNNTCPSRQGGAIMLSGANTLIQNCLFDGNSASLRGGAIMMQTGAGAAGNVTKIINSTFTNNTTTSATAENGYVLHSLYTETTTSTNNNFSLINSTVVGNSTVTADKSAIYTAGSKVEIAGSILLNNTSNGVQGTDIFVLSGTSRDGVVESSGYNVVSKITTGASAPGSEITYNINDVKYNNWAAAPLLNSVNPSNVMTPITTDNRWKTLKIIPSANLTASTWLGSTPKDLLGNARNSKLACSGSYELPAYVLEMATDNLTTPASGTHLYLKDALVTLSSTAQVTKWIINSVDVTEQAPTITMDKDYAANAVYLSTDDRALNHNSDFNVKVQNGAIEILGANGGTVDVYSFMGQKLLSNRINSDTSIFNLPNTNPQSIVIVCLTKNSTKQYFKIKL